MAVREALTKIIDGVDLSAAEASEVLEELVSGDVPPALTAAFLVALRMKGETPQEVAGLADAMRSRAIPVRPKRTGLVDTCGTGGDGSGTVNISTTAAFVVAGTGQPVAKHGTVGISSRSGSADVLKALGVPLDLTAGQVATCIDEAGFGFMFAPAFHPAMAAVMPVRRELGIRTVFNILGPLTNPARPTGQLIGVGDPALAQTVARALTHLGVERGIVVHGAGGADELTLAGESLVLTVRDGVVTKSSLTPDDVGLQRAGLETLAGGTPEENAKRLRAVLEGERGPVRDCVVLNAGAGLVAAGAAADIREGISLATAAIDDGAAGACLERLLTVIRTLS